MWITQKFKDDLKDWMEYEIKVLEKLKTLWFNLKKNIDEKWVDLVWVFDIEIKRDNKSIQTWNYFFETECRWKPSGLFKYANITYWIQWTDDKFHILDIDILKDLVLSKGWKVRGWDNNASWWYILSTKVIEQNAITTLFFNDNKDELREKA